jgi:hypothetical protein
MPFPSDLSDILPLPPGDRVVRRIAFNGDPVFIEVGRSHDHTYNIQMTVERNGQPLRLFGTDRLENEEEVEVIWREFMDERRSILKLRPTIRP